MIELLNRALKRHRTETTAAGTKRRTFLGENLAAARVTLNPGHLNELSALSGAGDRYPDMNWIKGDSASIPG